MKYITLLFLFLLASCSKDSSDTPLAEEYDINEVSSLTMNFERGLRNQEVVLGLIGDSNIDYTEFATFYVDGVALDGNIFSSPSEGVFEIYAEYNLAGTITTSEISTVEIFIPKRKVLFEDYTGTWCGFCTAMSARVDEMKSITNDISVIAIHVANDPFRFSDANLLIDHFDVSFIPTGYQDRQYFYGDAWPAEFVTDYGGLEVPLTIALSSSLEGNELTVNVDLLSEEAIEGNKLVVYLLEDGLIANQANSSNNDPDSPYYQMGNPIPNFVHDDVLRASLTELFGDPINSTSAFTTYSKTLTYTVPSEYNLDNLSLVAFVSDSEGIAINSQFADVNEDKSYE